jgi:membrane-associated protease RseP (regulator of RpoE activity)
MSGPKHLWSGDWRNESAAASDELAARRPKPRQPEQPQSNVWPPPPKPKRPRPGLRRALPIALAVVLVLAAGTYGATALFGSSKHQAPAFATQPSITPAPAPTSSASPPVYWLGMQIETVPPGAAAIATVRQGSPADLAGLSPGDAIVQIDSRPINGTGDISAAIRGMHAGQRVAMEISHGSALFTTVVTLAAPPSTSP